MALRLIQGEGVDQSAGANVLYRNYIEPFAHLAEEKSLRGGTSEMSIGELNLTPVEYEELRSVLATEAPDGGDINYASIVLKRVDLEEVGNTGRKVRYACGVTNLPVEPDELSEVFRVKSSNPYLGKKIVDIKAQLLAEQGEDAGIVANIDLLIDAVRDALAQSGVVEDGFVINREIAQLLLATGQAGAAVLCDFLASYDEYEDYDFSPGSEESGVDVYFTVEMLEEHINGSDNAKARAAIEMMTIITRAQKGNPKAGDDARFGELLKVISG